VSERGSECNILIKRMCKSHHGTNRGSLIENNYTKKKKKRRKEKKMPARVK